MGMLDTDLATLPVSNGSTTALAPRGLDWIPGFKWLRTKIGQLFKGPTYGMTPEEEAEYDAAQHWQARTEFVEKEQESAFKVAKFMAAAHPEWYWRKYVDPFARGTEERKRGLFLFVLVNKATFGSYFGRVPWQKYMLKEEFERMGIDLTKDQLATAYLNSPKKDQPEAVAKRTLGEGVPSGMRDRDQLLYRAMDTRLQRIDTSKLRPVEAKAVGRKRNPRKREFVLDISDVELFD